MEAGRAAGEHMPEREFFRVSPSDPMSFHVPSSLTSGSPSFTLPAGFRVPFLQHGLPLFEGGFQPPRPIVRPFVSTNVHVGGSSSHGAPVKMQVPRVVVDFTESTLPSSQEPMFDDSQVPVEGVADQSGGVDEVQYRPGADGKLEQVTAQREAEKLPANFSEQVFYAMDAFLGSRPAINPVLSESSPIDSPESEDDHAITENRSAPVNDFQSEPNTSASKRTDDGIESARHNSGKRKKDVSKSANAIVTAMSSFSDSFVAVEEKREEREAWKLKIQVDAEERHFKWLVEFEDKKEARKNAPDDELLVILMMMASTILLVQMYLESEDILLDGEEPTPPKRSRTVYQLMRRSLTLGPLLSSLLAV
ncbi:hypothetical protein R1sor_009487 [Riccia sorocarpa]|uniref:Uncharacterized protein n=1 Tax=Riccia sorocarpa TaxID=122646 RepID=A0ABD3HZD0_9MARC